MWKKTSKITDQTAEGQVGIRKKSKVPGVMITQFVEELPEGKTIPDFTRKPIALTIQEGKLAVFKAIVTGDPEPTVTWARNNGDVSDQQKYQTKFDPVSKEHTIEMPNVSPEQADTYKCFATNDFGRASVIVVLNVIEVGYKKDKAKKATKLDPNELKITLKRKSNVSPKPVQRKEGEIDPKFWEILLSAEKKDYECICAEYGVTDFRWMLKKLNEIKKEREEQQAAFVKSISNLKHIEVKPNGTALFEVDLDLIDPSSKIFIYKDGEMIEYSSKDMEMKHSLKQVGKKYVFTIRDLLPDDAGLYQVDVEDVTMFSTEFKIPKVDFLVKIQEVKAMEREDAVFECVLSNPFSKILWVGKNVPLEEGEKYHITVSEDKLIHQLVVKDCMLVDKGIYAAVAGIKSCNAWLIVEADNDPNLHGKKKVRKTTQAGRSNLDLTKIAAEQKTKLQKHKEEMISAIKTATPEKKPEDLGDSNTSGSESGCTVASVPEGGSVLESSANSESTIGSGSEGGSALASTAGSLSDSEPGVTPDSRRTDDQACLTSQLSEGPHGKPQEFVTRIKNNRTDGVYSNDAKKLSPEVPICKDSGTLKLIKQSCKDTNLDEQRLSANICNSQATVRDAPEFDRDELHKFSKPVVVKAGENATFKMMFPPQDSLEIRWFKEGLELMDGGEVNMVKKPNYSWLQMKNCLQSDAGEIKIQLQNLSGMVEALSRLIVLGRPSPPQGPIEVLECTSSVIELKWNPPSNNSGSPVKKYLIERQQTGQSIWKKLGEALSDQLTFRDRNVCHGKRYMYRVYAENSEGVSDPLETDNIMAGTLVFPDAPAPPKIVNAFKNCIKLEWAPPEKDSGTKILGYLLEKRKKDTNQWVALNSINEPIEALKYSVRNVSEGSEYEFRVTAINTSGAGQPSYPSLMVCAKNPNMKPCFKNPDDFMVVRAGNSVRIVVHYEASPLPEISWSKNNEPVSSWFKIVNTEGMSALTIHSSKCSDSGVYTIMARNSSGKTSFDIQVRVTDEPKKPGPVTLEQQVHGQVIITWIPSPDQELDDRLHYILAEHDTSTCIWHTIANRLFCTTYTANVQSGHEYHFRIYAKNDVGLSEPSESPTWGFHSVKPLLFRTLPAMVTFERPPSILVPLKVHSPPKGYQCYMTCAVRGCPTPHVSWYLNGICINSDKHYYITNVHGVCSIYISRVELKDAGEYKLVAVNSFGKAECFTQLNIKD